MKKWLTAAIIILSSSVHAQTTEGLDYKLVKESVTAEKTVYEFVFSDINGNPIIIPEKFAALLKNRISQFEISDVNYDGGIFTMDVVNEGLYKIGIKFSSNLDNKQALYSCFQDWYLGMDVSDQMILNDDLTQEGDEAEQEIRDFNNRLINHLVDHADCATKYPDNAIEDDVLATYYKIGFDRWYADIDLRQYKHFATLLKEAKETFVYNPSLTPDQETVKKYLAEWLKRVRERFAQYPQWNAFEEILLYKDTPKNVTYFTLNLMKVFTSVDDVIAFLQGGDMSNDLSNNIDDINHLLNACYFNDKYLCDKEQYQYLDRFKQLNFKSSYEEFSTFIGASGE